MKRVAIPLCAFIAFIAMVCTAVSQPPGGPPGGRKDVKGPPRFELGKVFPPGLKDELKLTKEQEQELATIEKELKEKLDKLLTAEQKKAVDNFRPRGPGGPPGGFPGGPPGGLPPERPARPEKPQAPEVTQTTSAIQWYATLDAGLAEANRTGKPILFVSAAPHCAGISGIW